MLAVPEELAGAAAAMPIGRRRSDVDRSICADGPLAAQLSRQSGRRSGDGVFAQGPAAGGAARPCIIEPRPANNGRALDLPDASRISRDALLEDPGVAQRGQQGMGHSPVRSRSARRQRRQAAGRRRERRTERRGRAAAGARFAPRHRDRLRHEPALRRLRHVSHGRQRDRRGGAQLRGRRGRSPRGSRFSTTSAGATPTGPETLGSLVRAALACHDLAVALGTPFISGKDSLNNEFSYADDDGQRQTIAIPPSLLDQRAGADRRRSAA